MAIRRVFDRVQLNMQVHSKMMIVDDEYIIIGSANINQRSQDGTRDTEIAMGASQHAYHSRGPVMPRGQVGCHAGSGYPYRAKCSKCCISSRAQERRFKVEGVDVEMHASELWDIQQLPSVLMPHEWVLRTQLFIKEPFAKHEGTHEPLQASEVHDGDA